MKTLRIINGIFWAAVLVAAAIVAATELPCTPTAFQCMAMSVMYLGLPAAVWYVVDYSLRERKKEDLF